MTSYVTDNHAAQTVSTTDVVKTTPALPSKARDLKRKSLRSRTTADLVEDVVMAGLYDDPAFQSLINAGVNAEAVEGSLKADDICAAQMIREAATDASPLKTKNLESLRIALNTVLRRYGVSRRERRELLSVES